MRLESSASVSAARPFSRRPHPRPRWMSSRPMLRVRPWTFAPGGAAMSMVDGNRYPPFLWQAVSQRLHCTYFASTDTLRPAVIIPRPHVASLWLSRPNLYWAPPRPLFIAMSYFSIHDGQLLCSSHSSFSFFRLFPPCCRGSLLVSVRF